MDSSSIIDRHTYEVYKHEEDCPFGFICDKEIADVVALLNKKGYKTFASCSGHYRNTFYEWFDEDIKNLDEYKNDKMNIITEVRDDSFDYISIVDKTLIYILFNGTYDLGVLPEGFIDNNTDGRSCIECSISYYDKDKRKKRNVVEKEIELQCNKLKEWVDSLPELKGMI